MISLFHKIFRGYLQMKEKLDLKITYYKYKMIGQIHFNKSVRIEPQASIVINYNDHDYQKYVIEIGDNSKIKNNAYLGSRTGFIKIGKKCTVNTNCILLGYGGITIGDHVRIAANTSIIAFNHNFEDPDKPIIAQGNNCKGIIIENDVWIGTGVRVLDGVKIGQGSIIGAGSVVTKDIEPYSVAVGVPAQVIKKRK